MYKSIKTAAVALCLVASLSAKGQTKDSTVAALQSRVDNIELNLKMCHNEFSSGTTTMAAGFAVAALGSYFIADSHSSGNLDPAATLRAGNAILFAGCAVMTVGAVLQIDAHRHLVLGFKN